MAISNAGARVVDPILTTVVQGYSNQEFVGNNLFPLVSVRTSGGKVVLFGREAFQLYSSARSPGSTTRRVQYGYLGVSYALEAHSLEGVVPREHQRDAAETMPGIDLGRGAVMKAMRALQLRLEVDQATTALDTNSYPATNKVALAAGARWSVSTVDPRIAVDVGREAVRSQCGTYPNVMVISPGAFNALRQNPFVRDQFKYTSGGSITEDLLAVFFSIEKVKVGRAVYWTDAGVATDIWGNNCVMAYVPQDQVGDREVGNPSFGYTYVMEGNPIAEMPYYDNPTKSWIYPVTYECKPNLTGIVAGYLIQTPA